MMGGSIMCAMRPGSADHASGRVETAVRVFLVDDHEIVRRGLREVIGRANDLEVIGEAGSVGSALDAIVASAPDVAVLDVRLGDGDGIDLCRSLAAAAPGVRCLILTSFLDRPTVERAVSAGAAGFLIKTLRGSKLVDSIRRIAAGESLLDESLAGLAEYPPSMSAGPSAPLSARETALLELITDGLTNGQIAAELDLSTKTVANNLSVLFAKLGMQRRTQVAAYGAGLRRGRRAERDDG